MNIYKKPLYEVREITDIRDMMRSSVEIYGDKAAFLEKKGQNFEAISYNQYKKDVEAFGTALYDMGLSGKRIAIIGDNCYGWCLSYTTVVSGLGVVVPLDKALPIEEIANALITSEAEAIIYSPKLKETVLKASENLINVKYKMEMYDDSYINRGNELLKQGNMEYVNARIDPEQMSILLFTSGTTAAAKAVMLSHRNIAVNLMAMSSLLYIAPSDIFLAILPPHHTYQCTCGFLCPIYRGATVAFCEGLRHIVDNLKETNATLMLCVPLVLETIYNRIWKQAQKTGQDKKLKIAIMLSDVLRKVGINKTKKLFASIHEMFGGSLRLFISGAAAIDPKIIKGFRSLGIDVVQGYGLTECAPIAALNRDCWYKDDSAGLPLKGVDIWIDEPDKSGVGEIVISGGNVMMGYYNNPDATAAVLRNGALYSGDLGYLDKDGFVHIVGRKKNVIITKNGINVYPEELETFLARSSVIKESIVSGKYNTKDDDTIVVADIVPEQDAVIELLGENYTQEQLHGIIAAEVKKTNELVQPYKRIISFTIRMEEFEKTTTQKIKRYAVKEQKEEIK